MELLNVRLADYHVGSQMPKIVTNLLIRCSSVNDGKPCDYLVQKLCIDLLTEGVIIQCVMSQSLASVMRVVMMQI